MRCPFCQSEELKVIDKRETPDNESIRRRRECEKCEKRFTTHERIESPNLFVIKKNGSRQEFVRDKLFKSFLKACEKRPISNEIIEEEVSKIEAKLKSFEETEIPSKYIGELVMKALKRMDQVAYIRFASIYRDFTDLSDYEEELKKLVKVEPKKIIKEN